MLESLNLDDKTYEELFEEAISQIPLYGSEWTNFNVSDPGVTILQNLTSFNYLQQSMINRVTDRIRLKLLALLGFVPKGTQAAGVLVEVPGMEEVFLPKYRKFSAGGMVFETVREERRLPWRIDSVFCEYEGKYTDVTCFLERDLDTGTAVFGSPARTGASLVCLLDGVPDFSEAVVLYARALDESKRNPFDDSDEPRFASVRWQVYTKGGWCDMDFTDSTHAFLTSGEIKLNSFSGELEIFKGIPGREGYALRCLLESEEYDITPRLHSISANLMTLSQRDTGAVMAKKTGRKEITLTIDNVYQHIYVYAREGRKEPYREYRTSYRGNERGRYFFSERSPDGTIRITFDKARFGFRPGNGKNDVILICCTEDMARKRSLGAVCGYLDQEFEIDFVKNILPDDFTVMLETMDDGGELAYYFIRPGEYDINGLMYELSATEGKIIIKEPGVGRNCRLYVAACATTAGAEGNVREENQFIRSEEGEETGKLSLINPAPGRGGVTEETMRDLRRRFAAVMRTPKTAARESDYESIVRGTPGLCIHKVKAAADMDTNTVKIIVKPHSDEPNPLLSESYMRNIAARLSECRMLTTMFRLVQPQYVPIDVAGTIYVKSRFGDARAEIESVLRTVLDFVNSEARFGEPVVFNKVYAAIAELPCVLSVYDLTLTPRNRSDVSVQGLDIIPGDRCLCCPGNIALEINTRSER